MVLRDFDRVFPADLRVRSALHWTPVDVAIRAARLLAPTDGARVLDVGAGAGKLCLVGALTTAGVWQGIEADRVLVDAATGAALVLGVDGRAAFAHGDAASIDWSPFDALYFFNPFASELEDGDGDPIARWSDFGARVKDTQERLVCARPGTRVVTYHGFGGEMPSGFELISRERAGTDDLALWIRTVA